MGVGQHANPLLFKNQLFSKRPDIGPPKLTHADIRQFYASKEWKKARKVSLERFGSACFECREKGITRASSIVHHRIPIRDGGAPLDQENLVPVCSECHESHHAKKGQSGQQMKTRNEWRELCRQLL